MRWNIEILSPQTKPTPTLNFTSSNILFTNYYREICYILVYTLKETSSEMKQLFFSKNNKLEKSIRTKLDINEAIDC